MMITDPLISQLSKNLEVFKLLLFNITKDEIHFKPNEKKWSVIEVACHLYDEELEDFRARVQHILETPDLPLKSINPVAWVKLRAYANQDYYNKINEFVTARNESVIWLQNLKNPKWDNVVHHTSLGDISAYRMLSNWVAHDLLHIRQITKLKYNYLQHISNQDLTYAGNW